MKLFLRIILFVFSSVLVYVLYLHHEITDEANYLTSKTCQQCHTTQYDSWRNNTLHPYMFLPVTSPDAKILGDFDSDNPVVTFKKEDIQFVLGGKWEQVYARIIDGEYYPFPAKWYVIQKRWVPYKISSWQDTPMSYKCNGCHTTGFDPNTLEFAEFGIGCEACHGPGSLHVQQKKIEHDLTCILCHEVGDSEHKEITNHNIIRSVSPSVCGQCHNRGTTSKGEVIKGTQFNFPIGFKPDDDLRATSFIPSTPENDKKNKNWWGNGLSKNRHQEFSDWSQSKHSTSLTHLLESHPSQESTRGVFTEACLECHSTDYRHASEAQKPSITTVRFGVTCIGCHDPHGQDKNIPGFGDGTTTCATCHIMSMAQNPTKHFPCPSAEVSCADCHMPRIVKTGGFFSLRSHGFRIIEPESSQGNEMPNSCQNSGCHADKSLQWAIEAYENFYIKEIGVNPKND